MSRTTMRNDPTFRRLQLHAMPWGNGKGPMPLRFVIFDGTRAAATNGLRLVAINHHLNMDYLHQLPFAVFADKATRSPAAKAFATWGEPVSYDPISRLIGVGEASIMYPDIGKVIPRQVDEVTTMPISDLRALASFGTLPVVHDHSGPLRCLKLEFGPALASTFNADAILAILKSFPDSQSVQLRSDGEYNPMRMDFDDGLAVLMPIRGCRRMQDMIYTTPTTPHVTIRRHERAERVLKAAMVIILERAANVPTGEVNAGLDALDQLQCAIDVLRADASPRREA